MIDWILTLHHLFKINQEAIYWVWLLLFILFVVNYVLANFLWILLPKNLQVKKMAFLLLVVVFATFIPILGTLFIILAMVLLYRFVTLYRKIKFTQTGIPEFKQEKMIKVIQFGAGGALTRAVSGGFELDDRIKSLLAINAIPTQQANAVNHLLLHDDSDELRLYAHSMLTKQEKDINNTIHDKLEQYKLAETQPAKAYFAKEIAMLYWNLLFLGLIKSDYLHDVIEKCYHFVQIALQTFPSDYILYLLTGKLLLYEKKEHEAEKQFNKALACQAPPVRVIPYLAEIFYQRKDFSTLSRILKQYPELQDVPKLGALLKFWCNA